jgi:hypothetical protein
MQKIVDDNPAVVYSRAFLAYALANLGDVFRSLGRVAEARGYYDRAIAHTEPQVHEHPAYARLRYHLVLCQTSNLG